MTGAERWRDNWRAVVPAGAVRVPVARSRSRRRAQERVLRQLPAGSDVALCAAAPGATRRCRALASRAGLQISREYLALPSASAPGYLVQDAPAPVDLLVETVLVTPPGSRLSALFDAGFRIVRRLKPHRLIRILAPGRVVVGRRT